MAVRKRATTTSRIEKTHTKKGLEKRDMVVVTSGERPIEQVAKDLESAGFKVNQVLHGIGQLTGSAHPELKKSLRSIPGVADVSDTHEDFNIGPPDGLVS